MADYRYDPHEIEPRWQRVWEEEQSWVVPEDGPTDRDAYVLEMLPYPSGEPHVGHLKNYTLGDAVAHFKRRTGHRVLHPMGYDSFGLPAENHAIKTGQHPRESTDAAIASFQEQFRRWGVSIDWTRELSTCTPEYYRWTQWIFLQLFERGLAYRKEAAVNWDPVDETVLANEQVIDGRGERSGALVEIRQLTQWFSGSPTTPSSCSTTSMASAGPSTSRRSSATGSVGRAAPRCSSRATSSHELHRLHHAPRHALRRHVLRDGARAPRCRGARQGHAAGGGGGRVRAPGDGRRHEGARRRGAREDGVFVGRTVTNPVNGEQLPIYVADYVLMDYGTGAIMAVPAHDQRDHAFALKYDLPIKRVIAGPDGDTSAESLPYSGDGPLVNSAAEFDGTPNREALDAIVDWLGPRGQGRGDGELPPA